MQPADYSNNKRQTPRFAFNFPIQLSFGSQITLTGQLKDLSLKSAFVKIKSSIYMQPNDELSFTIQRSLNSVEEFIHGLARISRIAKGEGIAIYFTKMDDNSTTRLKELLTVR